MNSNYFKRKILTGEISFMIVFNRNSIIYLKGKVFIMETKPLLKLKLCYDVEKSAFSYRALRYKKCNCSKRNLHFLSNMAELFLSLS